MKLKSILNLIVVATVLWSCVNGKSDKKDTIAQKESADFNYRVDQFADVKNQFLPQQM